MASYELFIGGRYLRAARGNRFVSFISMISMAGIAVGVMVLVVVLSVMNGFEVELRERILSMTSHATVSGFGGAMTEWQAVATRAKQHPEVAAVAPYVEGQALLAHREHSSGVQVYGIEPDAERTVSRLPELMNSGTLQELRAGTFGIVLGTELAKHLQVQVGDRITLVIPQAIITVAGVTPRTRRFEVVGTFSAGMFEYDRHFAYVHMADAARLYRMGDAVSGVRLRLNDLFQAPRVVQQIGNELGTGPYISDWTRRHENFFYSIALMKRILFFILLLVVVVAAFNIVSTLVMVVKDKRSDIAILRTLGATPRSILKIFVAQGTAIGLIGTGLGVLLGVLLSVNLEWLVHVLERVLGTRFLDAEVYFMSDLPAVVQWSDALQIALTAFGLCCLSTLYPAWRAARTHPAAALRHDS